MLISEFDAENDKRNKHVCRFFLSTTEQIIRQLSTEVTAVVSATSRCLFLYDDCWLSILKNKTKQKKPQKTLT